jgi:4-hydroxy-tetrahydrodipicolinate synthase
MGQLKSFKGTHTAIVTPFVSADGPIDYPSLEALLNFQHAAGVQGVVVCGSTGEAAALSDEEYRAVTAFVAAWCQGKMQVIAGIGTNNLARALEMAQYLSSLPLDGVLVVTPPYSKPSQDGMIQFFQQVKKATKQPLIGYNVPSRTGINLLPATVAALAKEGIFAALKDASGSIDQLMETQRLLECPFEIVSGEDSLIHAAMACGAVGTISASANIIPKLVEKITSAALRGDLKTSYQTQLEALPAVQAAFAESNPIPVKYGLFALGVIKSPSVRLPLTSALVATQSRLRGVLGV